MFRTALIAIAAIAAASSAAAQGASPARTLNNSQWQVVKAGQGTISHCVMGVRSDAAAPSAGKPQFMITADKDFAILRVRAAEWTFDGARSIDVTLTTGKGESQPGAMVSGRDLIDIAFGAESELATAGHIDITTEGTTVRLSLAGLAGALPAYRDCLASIGKPMNGYQVQASIAR
jgi:autotransporter translocation and assembly factor TamB